MSKLKGNLHTTIPVLYYYLSLHLPLPVRLVLFYVSVLLLSIIYLQLKELPELFWNNYFEFLVRQFIDIHFFRVSSWSCILFLWLYHISPILHDPCNLAFLRKQSPFPVITDWLWQGKFYTSHLGQKLWTGQLSGTLGRLPCEVHGQSLMSESTDRLSLSFCHERTFRPKGVFSALLVLCWEERDRRKVKLLYLPFKMSHFSFLCYTRLMKPLAWIPSILKRNFHPWAVVKLVFPWNRKAGTSSSAIFLMLIFFYHLVFHAMFKKPLTNQNHEYVILLKIHSFSSYIQVQDSFWNLFVNGHVWLFVTSCTIAHQAPLPTGFSRQEYWSG